MRKVSDFAEERNIDRNAVTQYIRRHPEMFEGHTKISGNSLVFDNDALELLDKKYPLPKPAIVVDGVSHEEYEELQRKLSDAKDIIMKMQSALAENDKLLIQKDADLKLLEAKDNLFSATIEDLKTEKSILQTEKESLKAEKSALQAEKEALNSKIDSLNAELVEAKRPKSLIERLFGK